ncbi:MAG: type II toxin-antitoxin system PemK/MazF family toxin [Nocardioidaceae bacterium]
MPTSGDVVLLDFGVPHGHEAGFPRPAVVVTASRVLKHRPPIVQVVPLASTLRDYDTDILVEADETNGLDVDSAAQCQHIRSVSAARLSEPVGMISPVQLLQIRETLGLLLDI